MHAGKPLFVLVALLLVGGACGRGGGAGAGGGGGAPRSSSAAPEMPGDLAAMRALLARYSPTGHAIVTTYEALPTRFVIGDTTSEISHSQGFDDFFPDGAPANLVDNMGTAVHEVYHAYASLMGYQLLVDGQGERGLGAEAVDVGGGPMLVAYSPTYPAREMAATFPAAARTSRFATYVSPSQDTQSTQQDGVFGLLDELAAYYHGARTRVDFWPWVRDEAQLDQQLLVNYVARFHEMWVPYAEFKLFILHYLRHARDHHPEVYAGLMANPSFRRAFVAVDDAYAALLAGAAALEPTVHAFARSRGLAAELRAGQLTIDGAPFHIRDDAYAEVLRQLASEPYVGLAAELRRGAP